MLLKHVLHDWPRTADYGINYPAQDYYTFFHFPIPFYVRVGEETVLCEPGACIMLSPSAYRYFHCYEPSTHNLLFLRTEAGPLIEKYQIPVDQLFYPKHTAFISDTFRVMEIEYFSHNIHREAILDLYVEEFLIKLARVLYDETDSKAKRPEQSALYEVRRMIISNCEKKWTVSEMAALASVSPSRFHALYSEVFGTTPITELTIARIDHAKVLLRSKEDYSVQDIAEKVGFQSQSHFIRKFKKIAGTTPHQYRKRFR